MIIPKKLLGSLMLLAVSIAVFLFSRGFGPASLFVSHGPIVPSTMHIVLFHFKEGVSTVAIKDVTSKFMALKKTCLNPHTQRPYIVSISGGKDMSIERAQDGMSHAFVVQFARRGDRDYHVREDPVYQAFKDATAQFFEKTLVVDFQDGVFTW